MRTRTFIALFLAAVITSISATPTSLAAGRFQSGKTGDGVKELVESARTSNRLGPTYVTANGARANVRIGVHDFLIQQNWVSDRKARCAMSR